MVSICRPSLSSIWCWRAECEDWGLTPLPRTQSDVTSLGCLIWSRAGSRSRGLSRELHYFVSQVTFHAGLWVFDWIWILEYSVLQILATIFMPNCISNCFWTFIEKKENFCKSKFSFSNQWSKEYKLDLQSVGSTLDLYILCANDIMFLTSILCGIFMGVLCLLSMLYLCVFLLLCGWNSTKF